MYYGCVYNMAADTSQYGYVLFAREHWVNSLVGCTTDERHLRFHRFYPNVKKIVLTSGEHFNTGFKCSKKGALYCLYKKCLR